MANSEHCNLCMFLTRFLQSRVPRTAVRITYKSTKLSASSAELYVHAEVMQLHGPVGIVWPCCPKASDPNKDKHGRINHAFQFVVRHPPDKHSNCGLIDLRLGIDAPFLAVSRVLTMCNTHSLDRISTQSCIRARRASETLF